ncbi:MAG: N utilization substance protein B [Gammaproteobacteria bacterium]|nr:MAG: N utilization substance protein B [Gammaproteobacteria bacterium]|tara:strand:- start:284 stop:700 length:417 start_codon:yes stop_codon:yes gene_type:complete
MTNFKSKERTLARENTLKVFYQHDINEYSFSDITKAFIEKRSFDEDYFNNIIELYELNTVKINNFIEENTDLLLKSLTPIDRSIIRIAMCELMYRDDIPKKVILNEAINIAKKYSSKESYKFINIILDKLINIMKKND